MQRGAERTEKDRNNINMLKNLYAEVRAQFGIGCIIGEKYTIKTYNCMRVM